MFTRMYGKRKKKNVQYNLKSFGGCLFMYVCVHTFTYAYDLGGCLSASSYCLIRMNFLYIFLFVGLELLS